MSDEAKQSTCCDCGCDKTLAFLLLRGWLGVRALITGIEKYTGQRAIEKAWTDAEGKPDAGGAMVDGGYEKFYSLTNYHAIPNSLKTKFAAEPLLPAALTGPFYSLLGPLLIILGITTLIGLGTRISLFAQGIIYIALTVGLILINQNDGVAWLAIHVAMIAMALTLAKHNRLAVCKKW